MRSRRVLAALPVLSLVAPLTVASAATATVVTAGHTYLPPDVAIAPGDSLELLNVDPAPHNVVSDATDRRGAQLFRSDTAAMGQRAVVKGVEKLPPGRYSFYCSVHPEMRSLLSVGKQATYVATPTGAVVPTATSITLFGDSLYVTSYLRGDVSKLLVLPGGALGPPVPYATGFSSPLGLAFGPDGTLFVSDSHVVGTATLGRVWAVPPGGGDAAQARVVVDGLPNGRHNTNGLAVSGNRLYVANGNNTDDGTGTPPEQPLSGTLLSVPLGARSVAPKASATLLVEARGMRNPYDVAFRPGTSEAWLPTNGPDQLDPYGDDLLHLVDVRKPVASFGFPACVYRTNPDGSFSYGQNTEVTARCDPRHKRPEASFGLHVSANGLAFGPEDAAWGGDLYVAEYGANTGTAGHQIVRVPITGGRAGRPQPLLSAPSPLDLCFGPPGTGLYVADFGSGAITLVRAVVG